MHHLCQLVSQINVDAALLIQPWHITYAFAWAHLYIFIFYFEIWFNHISWLPNIYEKANTFFYNIWSIFWPIHRKRFFQIVIFLVFVFVVVVERENQSLIVYCCCFFMHVCLLSSSFGSESVSIKVPWQTCPSSFFQLFAVSVYFLSISSFFLGRNS